MGFAIAKHSELRKRSWLGSFFSVVNVESHDVVLRVLVYLPKSDFFFSLSEYRLYSLCYIPFVSFRLVPYRYIFFFLVPRFIIFPDFGPSTLPTSPSTPSPSLSADPKPHTTCLPGMVLFLALGRKRRSSSTFLLLLRNLLLLLRNRKNKNLPSSSSSSSNLNLNSNSNSNPNSNQDQS